jgi:hypothetical protein
MACDQHNVGDKAEKQMGPSVLDWLLVGLSKWPAMTTIQMVVAMRLLCQSLLCAHFDHENVRSHKLLKLMISAP